MPELAVELWETLAEKGDLIGAREIWRDLWPLPAADRAKFAGILKQAGPAVVSE